MYVFYYKRLYNYGRKLTENTSLIEDAIQAIFIKLWKDRDKLSDISAPNAYIFYSFRNYIFKEKKKLLKLVFQKEDQEFSIDTIIVHHETTAELRNRIQKALVMLSPRQREAIFLRFYEALSFEEVAQVMNISVKATYKLMARSLLKLKELLGSNSILAIVLLYI